MAKDTLTYEEAREPRGFKPQNKGTLTFEEATGRDPVRTWGEAATDTGIGLASGVAGLAKTAGDLHGLASGDMDNVVSKYAGKARDYLVERKSDALKHKIDQRSQNIDAQDSVLGKAWTAAKDTLTDPALAMDTLSENVATMLPSAAVGRAVAGTKYARGFQAAQQAGPVSQAAQQAIARSAGRAGTAAAVGTGAVQQASDVSGEIYQDLMQSTPEERANNPLYQAALQRHGGNEQAAMHELALSTARGSFLPAAGISAVANIIPGATYLERMLVGAPLRQGAAQAGRFAAARGLARGVLGEAGQELIEEGGGQLAANLVAQNLADPNRDAMEGVGEAAGMGFAGGALLGIGGGVRGAREGAAARRRELADEPTDTPQDGDTEQRWWENYRDGNPDAPTRNYLAEIQEAVRNNTKFTDAETVRMVYDAMEDAWLAQNVGMVEQEGGPVALADAAAEQLGEALSMVDPGAIAATDARVRMGRILTGLQNILDEGPDNSTQVLNRLSAALQGINEAPLSVPEKARVKRLLDAHAAFTGQTSPANLPADHRAAPATDPHADNAAMESLIPERPSERLGLDANKGSLSAAAVVAVDTGASSVMQQLAESVSQQPTEAMDGTQADQTQQAGSQRTQTDGAQESGLERPGGEQAEANAGRAPAPTQTDGTQPDRLTEDRGKQKVLQNRDRRTAASVDQMNAIASNPDYMRTGPSRTMDQGAPVVFGDTPKGAALGRQETVVDGRGERIEMQYAVMEAGDVITSNQADGTTVEAYAHGEPGKVRAVAGNGRAAGLTEAWNRGTAGQYHQELMADLGSVGIDPEAVRGMKRPMLVRLMNEADVTDDIGDRSNVQSSARMSPVEQAANDARRVDLASLEFREDGQPTYETTKAFINAMPVSERGELLNSDGTPTRQAEDRLMAAVFKQAYGDDQLVQIHAQATEEEARAVMRALAQVAGLMVQLDGAGEFDIRQAVTDAARMAINAQRAGETLAKFIQRRGQDLHMNPEAMVFAEFMAENSRSAPRITDGLRRVASLALEQIRIVRDNQTQGGMFGDQPTLTRNQIFEALTDGETRQAPTAQPGRPEHVGQDTGRPAAEPAGTGDGTQDGREGGEERVQPGSQEAVERPDNWRSNYLRAAKVARELGIDPKQHKKLVDLVAAIDEHDGRANEQAAPDATEPLLTSPTREEILERQDQQERAEQEREAADRRADEQERQQREREEVRQRSEAAADTFELGQDAMDNLTGQTDIFSAPATPQGRSDAEVIEAWAPGAIRRQEREEQQQKDGQAKRDAHYQEVMNRPQPEWQTVEGESVLRIGDSNIVAVPLTGRKNAARFQIVDLSNKEEDLPQLTNKEVYRWLMVREYDRDADERAATTQGQKPDDGVVGKRADGMEIRRDEKGVRFYVENGIRISQKVTLTPRGWQAGELTDEFMTAEESASQNAEGNQAKKKQPGDPDYTLLDARNDLIALRSQVDASGQVVDARLSDRVSQQERLVREMEQAESQETQDTKRDDAPATDDAKAQSEGQAQAKADLMNALADLGDILGKGTRMNMMPEQEQKLLPVLTRVLDAAFRLGYHKFKDAAKFALDQIREHLGAEAADALTLDHLQGAYISANGSKQSQGADTKRAVVDVESKAEIESHEAAPSNPDVADNVETGGTTEGAQDAGTSVHREGASPLGAVASEDGGRDAGRGNAEHGGSKGKQGSGQAGGATDASGDAEARSRGSGTTGADSPAPRTRGGRSKSVGQRVKKQPGKQEAVEKQITESSPVNVPALDFAIDESLELGQGTELVKYQDNIAAIRTLKQIEKEGRRASPAEQRILARYVGWGGLKNAFQVAGATGTEGVAKGWERRVEEVKELLTPQEYRSARNSTTAAHYTSETVVRAGWEIARRMGFRGGSVLESSMGSGNFLGLMPQDFRGGSPVIGVEYDGITARIAALLYPNQTVLHSGFQNVPVPHGYFALSIGNPPFGRESLFFRHNPSVNGLSIHNQFFLASLDALAPNGIMVQVVSHFLMDAQDPSARLKMAERAEFLGGIRLPDTAFKENARTEVVTDILVFRKRTDDEMAAARIAAARAAGQEVKPPTESKFNELSPLEQDRVRRAFNEAPKLQAEIEAWTQAEKVQFEGENSDEAVGVNKYFMAHPELVVGTMDASGTMAARAGLNVRLDDPSTFSGRLDEAIEKLQKRDPVDGLDQSTTTHHQRMATSLRLTVNKVEVGAVTKSKDGTLKTALMMDMGEKTKPMMTEITLSDQTPWKPEYFYNVDGSWSILVDKKGPDGKPLKQLKADGTPSVYNQKEMLTYTKLSDIPSGDTWGEKRIQMVGDMLPVRDAMKRQVMLEASDAVPAMLEGNRRALNEAYDSFVSKHGPLHGRMASAVADYMPDGALALAAEVQDEDGSVRKADILSKRVTMPVKPVEKANSAREALAISLGETGSVDLDRIAGLLGTDQEGAQKALSEGENPAAFFDPERNAWVSSDEYLSGLVRRKMLAAQAAGLDGNVEALRAVQPEDWDSTQITPTIGSNWIPPSIYANFIEHLGYPKARVLYSLQTNSFDVHTEGSPKAEWMVGDGGLQPSTILANLLNSRPQIVRLRDSEGKSYIDKERSDASEMKAREIANEFLDWAYREDERRQLLTEIFNERYNTRVVRQRDGSHLILPGVNTNVKMRRHQMNGIWRGITDKVVLYDHVVGAGKTFTAIARAMERRRMGLSRKPMAVVPNHLVEQWASDIAFLYPGANVLAATKNDLQGVKRRRLFAKIAAGDYDLVVMGHSSFGFISLDPDTEARYLDDELRAAYAAHKEAEAEAEEQGIGGGRRKPFNVAEAERLVKKLEERMARLRDAKRDGLLTFEEMGIDDLTIDESHEFKNLAYSSRLTRVSGMGNKTGSNKAMDLHLKLRTLHERPNGSIAFLTGTPISNSVAEMYLILKNLAPNELLEMGMDNFDAWRAPFVSHGTAWEPTESGSLKEVARLGREWMNMRSLMDLYYSVADSVTLDDIKAAYKEETGKDFPVPQVRSQVDGNGDREMVAVKPSPEQRAILRDIVDGFNGLDGIQNPKERNAERLRLMDRARKVSLDARAVYAGTKVKRGTGKIGAVVDRVFKAYQRSDADKGTQLIFLDRSVPKSKGDDKIIKAYDALVAKRISAMNIQDEDKRDTEIAKIEDQLEKYDPNEIEELRNAQLGGWNAYAEIKDQLVELGIPEHQIRFVQEANTDLQKKALFDLVKSGEVRVLIGSTPRMGAGTNVQDRLVALHHVDVTWKPSDIEQREGRIVRQGNIFVEETLANGEPNPNYRAGFVVDVIAYATEMTVDAKMWTLNAAKLKAINGIRKYDGAFNMEIEDEESASMAEMAALATGNPLMVERVTLDGDIQKLESAQRSHDRRINGLRDNLSRARRAAEQNPGIADRIEAQAGIIESELSQIEGRSAQRHVTVNGKKHTDKAEAEQAAQDAIAEFRKENPKARFSIEIDGEKVSSQDAVDSAINGAMGDPNFEGSIDGEVTIESADLFRKIEADAMLKGGSEYVLSGIKYQGVSVEIDVSPSRWDSGTTKEVSFVAVDENGKTIASYTSSFKAGSLPRTSIREGMNRLGRQITPSALRMDAHDYRQRAEEARARIPDLEQAIEKPFQYAEELASKRDRLVEVIQQLAATSDSARLSDDEGGSMSVNEPTAPYTTDLFGEPIQQPRSSRAKPKREEVRRDAQPAAAVPGDTQAPAGDYFVRTKVGTTQHRQMGASHVRSFDDLAAATSYLYRSAVERLDGVVTDKDGKILAVVGGFKGAISQAAVYPSTLMGEAVRIPGAAQIWFSHNHPSGQSELSRADEQLNTTLTNVFRGSGIEPMGLIAVAGGTYSASNGATASIQARATKATVPVVERELADGAEPQTTINGTQDGKDAARAMYKQAKQPGLMLLNAQRQIVAWVPVPDAMLKELRNTGQLNALYRAISESNAVAAILVHGGEMDARVGTVSAQQNIAQALVHVDVRPLDAILIDGARATSAAEGRENIAGGPVYAGVVQTARQRAAERGPSRQGGRTDQAVMDMVREGQSAKNILGLIAETSRNKTYRKLARILLHTGATPGVVFSTEGMGSDGRFSLLASYSRANNAITMTDGAAHMAEQVFLHEMVHAATLIALDRKGAASLHMRNLFNHVKGQESADIYGLKNVGEFVAEALTNPEFQRLLQNTTMPERSPFRSAWESFVRAVMSALGIQNRGDYNMLSEVLQASAAVLREDMGLRQGGAQHREAGAFDPNDPDISHFGTADLSSAARNVGDGLKSMAVTDIRHAGKRKLTDWLGLGLQFLGRRQLVDIYGKVLPLAEYDRLVAQMGADKNDVGATADELARRWGKLPDEGKLAELMHDATLAQIDADSDVAYADGDDQMQSQALKGRFKQLTPDAQKVYREARDHYKEHHAEVRKAIIARINRSELRSSKKAEMVKNLDGELFGRVKGVYFPLARFGEYVVVAKDSGGHTVSVSRAETMREAENMRAEMVKAFPESKGYSVGRVLLSKEFVADRDMVGRGFMEELYGALDQHDMPAAERAELEDTLGQLYLASLPDLSWAKHGIHRKGTPGFSQDARRAFAQNVFHGARYLAKLKYSDLMQDELRKMQKHVDDWSQVEDFDQPSAQRVVNEFNKRHTNLMSPQGNPISTALTSFGFVYYLGASPAAAIVNLTQTPLVAYPMMGAKWGFRKAGAALLQASKETAMAGNDLRSALKNADEIRAFDEAVRAGTIDVTQAHDLAGIAQGEDAKMVWRMRPVMRVASFMFHNAEKFNRQATFIAAYRLAKDTGANHQSAFEQATKATYDGHFDYSIDNRARVLQGNVARVMFLFKQFGQNMAYAFARSAHQSLRGESPEVRKEARKVFAALIASHAAGAGVLGLPLVKMLLGLASAIGSDDDEPWDAEVAMRNMLADAFGPKASEVMARGLSRLTPWDISGRLELDDMIFPDVQEGLEGQRLVEAATTAMMGPVVGIGVGAAKAVQNIAGGEYGRALEEFLPIAMRNQIKAMRFWDEGAIDRTGVVVKDEVSLGGVLGQAVGFSPSEVRLAFEGRSAIYRADRELGERRSALMTQFAKAAMKKDDAGMNRAREAIARFNEVNPDRRITAPQMWQSVRNRQRRIDQADSGVYLPRNRRGLVDEGRFANVS